MNAHIRKCEYYAGIPAVNSGTQTQQERLAVVKRHTREGGGVEGRKGGMVSQLARE